MAEQPALEFAGLLRQLRAGAQLTQEELAEAAGLSPRSVSDLERGINRTARKDTAELLAGALGLAEPTRALFVAAARGRAPAEEVLAAVGTGVVYSVAFSPDGHTLASGSSPADGSGGGTVQLWDVADPAHPRLLGQPLTVGSAPLLSVAFSPHGHTLAGGDYGGTIQLWDVTDPAHPRPLGQPPTGGASAVDSVAFSPDGHTLASGSLDGTTRLWNLNVQYAIQRICATAGGLTPRQWDQYIPNLRYQSSCLH